MKAGVKVFVAVATLARLSCSFKAGVMYASPLPWETEKRWNEGGRESKKKTARSVLAPLCVSMVAGAALSLCLFFPRPSLLFPRNIGDKQAEAQIRPLL